MNDENNPIKKAYDAAIAAGALNPIIQIGEVEMVTKTKAEDMLQRIVAVGYSLRLWAARLRINGDIRSIGYAARLDALATMLETGEVPGENSDQQD